MEKENRDALISFLNSPSSWEDRILGFNLLYDPNINNFKKGRFSKQTKKYLNNGVTDFIKNLTDKVKSNSQNSINWNLVFKQENDNWIQLVEHISNRLAAYENKIRKEINTPLKFLVVGEAPLLNFENESLVCNQYLFGNNSGGLYRVIPYQAFGGTKDSKITSSDLINIFASNDVGFIDLISFPLPKLSSDLRKKWGYDKAYYVNDIPRTVFYFENALSEFLKKTNRSVNCDTKVIFMMPPITATSIINFFSNYSESEKSCCSLESSMLINSINRLNTSEDLHKINGESFGILRLHRQIAMNGSNSPDLHFFKWAME
jgi:hypothetical protein